METFRRGISPRLFSLVETIGNQVYHLQIQEIYFYA